MKKWLLLLLLLLVGCVSACNEELRYLLQQAPGQIAILLHREKIATMLENPDLDPEARRKLELVLDVKRYAEDRIGLVHNQNYSVYTQIDRDAVVYTLSACPPLSFQAKTWKFPVVGEAPYLGFFKKADGEKKKARLEAEGYDVYLRPAGAYSMLGIASDPIYSPLLKLNDAELANLVVHELSHATIWVPGQVEFDESVALFIGNEGSLEYLEKRFGADADPVRYALGANEDDKTFSVFLSGLYQELDQLYQSDLSDAGKLERKAEIIAAGRRRFREEVLPRMKTDDYRRFPESVLNNASILQRKLYYKDVSLYYRVFDAHHRELRATVDFFKEIAKPGGDVEAAVRQWLDQRQP
jgi:predicted aminopeptidase